MKTRIIVRYGRFVPQCRGLLFFWWRDFVWLKYGDYDSATYDTKEEAQRAIEEYLSEKGPVVVAQQ